MKNRFIKILFVASLLTLSSCGDDYLDPMHTTQLLTDETLQEAAEHNPEIILGTLNGVYTLMISPGAAGTDLQHYDFGQKSTDIWLDMLVGDMALATNSYNWYARFTQFQVTQDFSQEENYLVWKYYYSVVKSANSIINALGGNDADPEDPSARYMLGQAKALRAHSYFYLVNLFTREYDAAREVIPVYTEMGMAPQPKSTMGEVYALIIDDLSEAISLLDGFNRSFKHEINKEVAQGLLAYTYAAMGNYSEAKIISDQVIASGYPLTTAAQTAGTVAPAGFNQVSTPSWLWGYDLEESLGINLVSWWGQIDWFTYSYAYAGDRKAVDLGLFDQIPTTDVRKGQFNPALSYMPTNKFFHPDRAEGGQRYISTDYIFMRVDEMYLLNAEAAAKSGDEPGARARLIELLSLRLTGGVAAATSLVDPLSGQALLDEIYKQTRIELWGEGKAYFAMKRHQATITRGSNHLFHPGVVIPYNDDRMFFKIPQNEILNNPHISGQN